MWKSLQGFDVYRKIKDEAQTKTYTGAVLTIVTLCVIGILFLNELSYYITGTTSDKVIVDHLPDQNMDIKFDITFPHVPCSLLEVDATDNKGTRTNNFNIQKLDIDPNKPIGASQNFYSQAKPVSLGDKVDLENHKLAGENPLLDPQYCGSCYGAEQSADSCCNTCQDVVEAYAAKGWSAPDLHGLEQCLWQGDAKKLIKEQLENGFGCRFKGTLTMGKGTGSFHFAPGNAIHLSHGHADILGENALDEIFTKHNFTHTINDLTFGQAYPGLVKPLNGVTKVQPEGSSSQVYMYYAEVVPTSYTNMRGRSKLTNQFSVTEHTRDANRHLFGTSNALPGMYFFYSTSPIRIDIQQNRPAFLHFVTQTIAIIGGVYAVAGIIDRVIFSSTRAIQAKMAVGKQN